MKFCSACGAEVAFRIPPGDNRERHVCDACDTVHYQNPTIVAGCIAHWQDRILLCRRAIEPRYGLWTLPAGFMERGESTLQAAAREAEEEACATIDGLTLYGIYNMIHISQVYVIFRGELRGGQAGAGEESLEVALYGENEIPWDDLAFPVVRETLERYLEERRDGAFRVHSGDFDRAPDGGVILRRNEPLG